MRARSTRHVHLGVSVEEDGSFSIGREVSDDEGSATDSPEPLALWKVRELITLRSRQPLLIGCVPGHADLLLLDDLGRAVTEQASG